VCIAQPGLATVIMFPDLTIDEKHVTLRNSWLCGYLNLSQVFFMPGTIFSDEPEAANYIRVSFSFNGEAALEDAVSRLAEGIALVKQ